MEIPDQKSIVVSGTGIWWSNWGTTYGRIPIWYRSTRRKRCPIGQSAAHKIRRPSESQLVWALPPNPYDKVHVQQSFHSRDLPPPTSSPIQPQIQELPQNILLPQLRHHENPCSSRSRDRVYGIDEGRKERGVVYAVNRENYIPCALAGRFELRGRGDLWYRTITCPRGSAWKRSKREPVHFLDRDIRL